MNQNFQIKYCIHCERWAEVEHGVHIRQVHLAWDAPIEFLKCFGPFAECEPPEMDNLHILDEPSPDELEQINQDAEMLKEDI